MRIELCKIVLKSENLKWLIKNLIVSIVAIITHYTYPTEYRRTEILMSDH